MTIEDIIEYLTIGIAGGIVLTFMPALLGHAISVISGIIKRVS